MAGQLQVRQGQLRPVGGHDEAPHYAVRWSGWCDIPSPAWLAGFTIPNSGLVYEFRNEPEVV